MSLKLLAKQMEAKGRKGDSMLVHMTPGEVAGLQKLAESAGGSLTVNPETGLVEANFLKRMLPGVLLPLAAGMVGGPLAAAAVGAAVGGYQAKKNDQDVLLGAALGGVSGYGAGSLGAGLNAAGSQAAQAGAMQTAVADQAAQQTAQQAIQNEAAQQAVQQGVQAETANMLTLGSDQAAQAAFNTQQQELSAQAIQQAADAEAQRFAAQGLGDRAGQGISALVDQGSNVGREAFMSKVGGGAGLVSDVSMAAAAPLMAPGKAPGEAPVDDEMYVYDYDVGRTGAERAPSDSSAERTYFEGRYSPMRRVRAKDYGYAEGGLMGLAEGGDVAAPAGATADAMNYLMGGTGSSQAGLSYLMGETNQSPVMQSAAARQNTVSNFVAPERGRSTIGSTSGYSQITEGPYKGLYQSEAPKFAFDPTAQKYYRADDVFEYIAPPPEPMYDYGGGNAAGGLIGLAKGGMASGGFVVPADVVSALGNGSTDAGLRSLDAMLGGVKPIKGKGDGLSDSIKTNIDGKQPARVADGEAYIDPKTVKRVGGAKKLYAMMDKVRAQAHGKTSQQRKVNPAKVLA